MPFLRQLYKQKPQAWGPASAVQASIFDNAERIGIDPASIALAMPMWGPGNQLDYIVNRSFAPGSAVSFENNALKFPATGTGAELIIGNIGQKASGGTIVLSATAIANKTSGYLFAGLTVSSERYYIINENGAFRWGLRENQLVTSGPLEVGKLHALGISWNSLNGKAFYDGQHVSSTTYTAVNNDIILGSLGVHPGLTGNSTYQCNSFIHVFYVFRVELPTDKAALVTSNPYFLLQRVAPVYYSLPLSLNLTQYAFRFRNDNGSESLQSKAGAVFLRRSYKQKPQAYGPPSVVQASIFKNAERAGMPPPFLYLPIWEGAGRNLVDYAGGNQFNNWYSAGVVPYWVNNLVYQPNTGNSTSIYCSMLNNLPTIGTGQYTVLVRCIPTSISTAMGLISFGNYDPLWQTKVTTGYITIYDGGALGQSTAGVIVNSMNDLAFVRNSTATNGTSYFIDGKAVGTATHNASIAKPTTIILMNESTTGAPIFKGYYDKVALWSTALTASQVAMEYDNPYFLLQRVAPVTFSIPKPAATYSANENTNITLTPGSKTRIRIGIDATGDPTSKQFQLEYRHKPSGGSFGTWGAVT